MTAPIDDPARLLGLPDDRRTDVLCLGHALVDRLAFVGPETVAAAGLELDSMVLVDTARAAELASVASDWRQVAGGSAANTAVGVASLGGRPAYLGSVGLDELGAAYDLGLSTAGVRCVLAAGIDGEATGQCLSFVTPDAKRSMATNLGAGATITVEAVERAEVPAAAVVYLEGYLFDSPGTLEAVGRAVELARAAGSVVAVTLSDPFLVGRHRQAMLELLAGPAGLVFANEEEALAVTGAADLAGALQALVGLGLVAAVTRGAAGAVVAAGTDRAEIAAWPVAEVVDTTGAGDLFAAGVLFGLTHGATLELAGRLGALAAGEVISHLGARPEASLWALASSAGLPGFD